ncbi:anti-sigma factor [Thalassobacillus sp. CUG 92003]|uniref:anti-sigma factor n=1 Tax=Thalassobacillus sp. CUG 92003 TaxID=2736641 RepID=UPI0015E7C06D|nr:anti-sigma factor [Thalassobacillus sp. CUG 92003]
MTEWTEAKEKRILWKYRFSLTFRVIRILLGIFLLYVLYNASIHLFYDYSNSGEKNAYYAKLAIEWKYPALQTDFHNPPADITPLLTQSLEIPVSRKVGAEAENVGMADIHKTIFPWFSSQSMEFFEHNQQGPFTFYLPENPRNGEPATFIDSDQVWERLDKVHEGTVADLAFSTKSFHTPEEMSELLAGYDVDIEWMALYTGELSDFEIGYSQSGGALMVNGIGLSAGREIDKQTYQSGATYPLSQKNIGQSKDLMLANMKNILDKGMPYYKHFLELPHLQERYTYMNEHGFDVYGAVVTGPVEELLKLREESQLHGVSLGELEYWNWD